MPLYIVPTKSSGVVGSSGSGFGVGGTTGSSPPDGLSEPQPVSEQAAMIATEYKNLCRIIIFFNKLIYYFCGQSTPLALSPGPPPAVKPRLSPDFQGDIQKA